MSTATPNYKQEVVDCLICMMTQIWLHCTCLQVLILWGSPMNLTGFRCNTIHPSDIMRNHPLYNDFSSKKLRISRMWFISWNWQWADSHRIWGGDITRPDTGSWWSSTWKLCTGKNTISISSLFQTPCQWMLCTHVQEGWKARSIQKEYSPCDRIIPVTEITSWC